MITTYALIIMVLYGDNGAALNTELRFLAKESCEVAASQVTAFAPKYGSIKATCVEVN